MFAKQIKIPEPEEIKQALPLPEELRAVKEANDKAVSDVISGASDKLIIIEIGRAHV